MWSKHTQHLETHKDTLVASPLYVLLPLCPGPRRVHGWDFPQCQELQSARVRWFSQRRLQSSVWSDRSSCSGKLKVTGFILGSEPWKLVSDLNWTSDVFLKRSGGSSRVWEMSPCENKSGKCQRRRQPGKPMTVERFRRRRSMPECSVSCVLYHHLHSMLCLKTASVCASEQIWQVEIILTGIDFLLLHSNTLCHLIYMFWWIKTYTGNMLLWTLCGEETKWIKWMSTLMNKIMK